MDKLLIKPDEKILFQGDSVTDAGRGYEDDSNMGLGYPNFISAWLSAKLKNYNLTFINRGISGDRIHDLENRWQKDCIDIQPDWLSILIGINDTWRRYDSNIISKIDDFDATYRKILDKTKSETSAKLIIMDPFVLPVQKGMETWGEDLHPRIEAIHKIAKDYDALLIPLNDIFNKAATIREATLWTPDGVHPSQVGHALIAQEWIKTIGID